MDIERGDIVYIQHIDNRSLGKNVQNPERPYIVISNNINNTKGPTVILACLTGNTNKANYPMHVFLSKSKYNNLKKNSLILTEQILTINKDLIDCVIDKIDEKDKKRLNEALTIQLLKDCPRRVKHESKK